MSNQKNAIMKRILTFAALTLLVSIVTTNANANIRRVGFFGAPIANTDYTSLQSAHNAAAAGDTILVFPGDWTASYSKTLVTIGYGYFVDVSSLGTAANAGLQHLTGHLSIGIGLAAGCDNSVFEGLDGFNIGGLGTGATLSGIIIRRCNGTVGFAANNAYNNWQIVQCYLLRLGLNENENGATISNLTVSNCIIGSLNGGTLHFTNNGQFTNNIFLNTAQFGNGTYLVKNNIFLGNICSANRGFDINCVYTNNIENGDCGCRITGTQNTCRSGSELGSLFFVGYSSQGSFSHDARFQLKAGSPAIGFGEGGVDCGIFGGPNPYHLSGIPPVPAFYKLTANSTTASSNPYTVTFSVRSNN